MRQTDPQEQRRPSVGAITWLACAVSCGVWALTFTPPSSAPAPQPSRPEPEYAAAVPTPIPVAPPLRAATRAASAPAAAAPRPRTTSPRPDPEANLPLPSPSSEERWQALDSAWAIETDDANWSREMYDYMAETAQAIHIEPSAIQSVTCKTTVCRLRLAFPSLMDANDFQEAANPAYQYELRGLPTPEGESLAQYDVLVSRASEPPQD